MYVKEPPQHTLYMNGIEVPIIIPGDMDMKLYNMRVLKFQFYRVGLPRELMGVLTNHVWADACLDVDLGFRPPIMAGGEPDHLFNRFEGYIGISSYEEKGVCQDILLLNHVHFTLHLR